MGGWLALTRVKLYLLVGTAFLLGIMGVRAKLLSEGEARLRARVDAGRVLAAGKALEVRNEVEAFDRDTLRGRASIWVRGGKPKR